jgi:hypothetical protein
MRDILAYNEFLRAQLQKEIEVYEQNLLNRKYHNIEDVSYYSGVRFALCSIRDSLDALKHSFLKDE